MSDLELSEDCVGSVVCKELDKLEMSGWKSNAVLKVALDESSSQRVRLQNELDEANRQQEISRL
jgi:hypothetical protein